MSKVKYQTKWIQYLLIPATLAVFSQGSFAHTRLEYPNVIENGSVHNRLNTGHGCPTSTTAKGSTFAQSAIFPNAISYTPIIGVDSSATGSTWKNATYTTAAASTFYSPLAGIGALLRADGAWPITLQKTDAKGNNDGFLAGGKAYDQTVSAGVQTSVKTAAITIPATSCARSVTFMLAVADICDINVPSAVATDKEVLYWSPIPNFTGVPGQPFGSSKGNPTNPNIAGGIPVGPAYSNYDGYTDAAHTIAGDGWASPATLKVWRNTTGTPATVANGVYTAALAANPLPAGCTGHGGLGDDVYVFPSAAQINAEMPMYSGVKQSGTLYWQ